MAKNRVRTMVCNDEIELSLINDTERIARKYRIDLHPKSIVIDDDLDSDLIVVGVKPNHHPMNREDRRRYARSEKKHLEKLSKYAFCGVRLTRNGAYVRERSNDGTKEYLKGKKLWNKKIRHERFEFDEDDCTDHELGYDHDAYECINNYGSCFANDYMIYQCNRYDSESILKHLKDQPEPKVFIVAYSYDSWEDYYEVEEYFTSLDSLKDEIDSHMIPDNENDVAVYGLYPSDVGKLEKVMMYHHIIY